MPSESMLGRYDIIRVLGRGAMGEVLEVRDNQTQDHYALKRVPAELSRSPAKLRALRNNFSLVSKLTHPHIATTRFLEVDPENGDVYIIMDLVRGCDLGYWLVEERERRGSPESPLPMDLVLGLAEQIASALDYAHSQPVGYSEDGTAKSFGILHRDLKPENIMIEMGRQYRRGIPYLKIVDFGIAAQIQSDINSMTHYQGGVNAVMGTPLYMAPEQWQGRRLSRAIDQWALAVIIYELAEGRLPFNGITPSDLRERICNEAPISPEVLTAVQWNALKKSFAQDRTKRYSSTTELVKAVANANDATRNTIQLVDPDLPEEGAVGSQDLVKIISQDQQIKGTLDSAAISTEESIRQTTIPESLMEEIARQRNEKRNRSNSSLRTTKRPFLWKMFLAFSLTLISILVGYRLLENKDTIRNILQDYLSNQAEQPSNSIESLPIEESFGQKTFAASKSTSQGTPQVASQSPTLQTITNSIGMRMVLLPPGEFQMGSTKADPNASSEEMPQHLVKLSGSFYLGEAEVTQGQWIQIMDTIPWKDHTDVREGESYPAACVSWGDAMVFCRRLSQLEGNTYRLPTEAEWEYACRAGTTTLYSFGDESAELEEFAWFNMNAMNRNRQYPHEIKQKKANPFGLFDMHGNVYEWCSDWIVQYPQNSVSDPRGSIDGEYFALRGGSWGSGATSCRSAFRGRKSPSDRSHLNGFRIAMSSADYKQKKQALKQENNPKAEIGLMEGKAEVPAVTTFGEKIFSNSIGLTMTLIPAGKFNMGDAKTGVHEVTLTKSFYLGETEVTQGEWKSIMNSAPWQGQSYVQDHPNNPATYITYEDAKSFCKTLSEREKREYRLPTEAEWEYACRGGTQTKYHFGEDSSLMDQYEWFNENADKKNEKYSHKVKLKKANPFGLYDMHGNVWEWCGDWYGDYPKVAVTDPQGPDKGTTRVFRGGSWFSGAIGSSDRYAADPTEKFRAVSGFRVALTYSASSK
jgi:formylglycine-generating enzyme required for sulfatase activity